MRLFILYFFLLTSWVNAEVTDCTKVFEERKVELLKEIEKIDEARQSFEALKAASNALFDKRDAALKEKQLQVDEVLRQINEKEKSIEILIKKNEALLASIDDIKDNKISETYNKMKEGSAASILESMKRPEAAGILFTLPAKKVSKIMAKMTPEAASDVTVLLTKGPPFDEANTSKE